MAIYAPVLDALDHLEEALRTRQKLRTVLRLEARLVVRLRRTFRAQQRAVLAALAPMRERMDAKPATLREAVDPAELDHRLGQAVQEDAALAATIEVLAGDAMAAGAGHTAAELAVIGSFSPEWPEAVEYMQGYGAKQVAAIDDITRQRLRTLLMEAADKGWSYQETAKGIRELFASFTRARAKLIAVTEIGEAYEYGGRVVGDRLVAQGLVLEKLWLVTGDARTCPICAPNGARGWIPIGDTFPSGHSGPLAHPGCRCATARRVKKADR